MMTKTSQASEAATIQGLLKRTAPHFAAFFLPYLQPGMRLLDCGCGPGSITLGLAAAVAPGEVVGIDVNAESIAVAQNHATQEGVANLRFEVANVYALPFPAGSFDAVFSYALLLHVSERGKALQEMRRVLKPGGLIGIRNDDLDGYLIAPPDPLLAQGWDLLGKLVLQKGGNARDAKRQRAWLNAAGFIDVQASASYECYGSTVATTAWSALFVSILLNPENRFVEQGWVGQAMLDKIVAAWQAWSTDPNAFLARSWCEAIAWVA
jgi:SAM-dependent methyltransferase